MRESAPITAVLGGSTFVRSAMVSVLATLTDFAIATLLSRASVASAAATFVGCAAGGLVAFLVNRGWAFRSNGHRGAQLARFLGVWATSALLNSGGVGWLTHAGMPFMYAWILVRGLVYSGWNYPLLRWFVFKRAPSVAV
ncbi:MAG: GtrA family protein [Polyangiaceae bacterium]